MYKEMSTENQINLCAKAANNMRSAIEALRKVNVPSTLYIAAELEDLLGVAYPDRNTGLDGYIAILLKRVKS